MNDNIQTIVLVILTIAFLMNAAGPSKTFAHGGNYARPIMIINIALAAICFGMFIWKVTSG